MLASLSDDPVRPVLIDSIETGKGLAGLGGRANGVGVARARQDIDDRAVALVAGIFEQRPLRGAEQHLGAPGAGEGRRVVHRDVVEQLAGSAAREPLDHARAAGLGPIKINAVIQRGVNEDSVLPLVERFRGTGITVRFIEYMDVGNRNDWREQLVVPSRDLMARIHARWPLHAVKPDYVGEVARRYAFDDAQGEVGFISSVTQPFCSECSRARLSTEGRLYTCLFADQGHDFRSLLRGNYSDEQISAAIAAVWLGRADRYSEVRTSQTTSRRKIEMSYIGG